VNRREFWKSLVGAGVFLSRGEKEEPKEPSVHSIYSAPDTFVVVKKQTGEAVSVKEVSPNDRVEIVFE